MSRSAEWAAGLDDDVDDRDQPVHDLCVDAFAPHPTWDQCCATDDEADKRLFQLMRSWKEGTWWRGPSGTNEDQCDYIIAQVERVLWVFDALDKGRAFVVVPRSGVTRPTWPAPADCPGLRLAAELSKRTGNTLLDGFDRVRAVDPASKSVGKSRPTIDDHVASMELRRSLLRHPRTLPITLVDDVLTRGTQLAACATMLFRAGFVDVRALTAAYVLRNAHDDREWSVTRRVRWAAGDAYATVGPA